MTTPTPEGMRRYPSTQGYFEFTPSVWSTEQAPQPCVCIESCPMPCPGDCGCTACIWRDVQDNMMGQTYPHQ
jgi:hypothetical protein